MAGLVGAVAFGGLAGLIVWGRGTPDTYRGVVRRVEPDDGSAAGALTESRRRVAVRGELRREEDVDGTVLRIAGVDADWFRAPDRATTSSGVLWMRRREAHQDHQRGPIGGRDVGGPRPSWERWMGTDFTRPTGPVVEAEFLGRPAWVVELAPPSHKPYPLQLLVDAATGLVMRTANEGFGSVEEWLEFDVDPVLPDAIFVWDGPAKPTPSREEREAAWRAEEAERTAWLARRGLATIPLCLEAGVRLHQWDDESGSLYASVEPHGSAVLIRRPRSDEPWPEPETTNYPHSWRWRDENWDWFFATGASLSNSALGTLKAHLATTA